MNTQELRAVLAEKKASDNPLTTISGGVMSLAGTLMVLVPAEVREPCMAAISASESPVVVGTLLGVGTLLTFLGPSLVGRSKK